MWPRHIEKEVNALSRSHLPLISFPAPSPEMMSCPNAGVSHDILNENSLCALESFIKLEGINSP